MSVPNDLCHGQFGCLQAASTPRRMVVFFRVYQKLRSYAVWHLENRGVWGTLTHTLWRFGCALTLSRSRSASGRKSRTHHADREVLGLRPGELVEVRPVEEIMATLDADRRQRGLLWMTGMRKHCGRRYRVLKRVETIVLETNGELRTMHNTVLLEGAMCDGSEFGGCDRSCFHFWREAWLRRVEGTPVS